MTEETAPRRGRPPIERPDMREAMREDDPRKRAATRAAQLLEDIDFDNTTQDGFSAPPPPPGWTYEWKRHLTLNAPDPSYQVELAQMGWEPVPADRHPELMPKGWSGATVERKGMVLMERPAVITAKIRARDQREAESRVQGLRDRLNVAPQGQFQRQDNRGESLVKIKKSHTPIEIPTE